METINYFRSHEIVEALGFITGLKQGKTGLSYRWIDIFFSKSAQWQKYPKSVHQHEI